MWLPKHLKQYYHPPHKLNPERSGFLNLPA
jgi:hypothetical protein